MKRSLIIIIGGLIAVSTILSSCSSDDEIQKEAPDMPPKSSMISDFGNFPQNENGRVDHETSNFGFAALNVVFWQSILTIDLALPVAAFDKAFDNRLQYLEDEDRWVSTYSVTVGSTTVEASLYAEYISGGDKVKWDMYLSSEGNFDDFLWFTGQSKADGSGGEWMLYRSPTQNREMLGIEWVRNGDTEIVNSTYVLVDEQTQNEGSMVSYGLSAETGFTHYYDVSIVSKSSDGYDLMIMFNDNTKSGRVKSEAHFEDALWHCWNDSLEDITCPL